MPENPTKLVEKAKKGDKDAFGEIYSLYLTPVYRFIFYLVYDKSLAEDITQETFLKAWKYLPKFSVKKGTIQAFLYTIARNLVVDTRRKKKELRVESDFVSNIRSNENLEENYIDGERNDIVHTALSFLDDKEKELVILRYFEELSFAEIAEVTKEKEGNLRVKIHRVLKKLKGYLDRQAYADK